MSVIPTWMKVLIIGAVVAAVYLFISHEITSYGSDRFTAGQKDRQKDWDDQKIIDGQETLKRIADAIAKERQGAADQAVIANALYGRKQNEKTELAITLDAIHNDTSQLRKVTGKAIREPENAATETNGTTTRAPEEELCTVQLPSEIGDGFRRLQETIVRLGSEANDKDDELRAAIEILELDRKTCNGN